MELSTVFKEINIVSGKKWSVEHVVTPDKNGGSVYTLSHYGDSIEIIIYKDISGDAYIDGEHFSFSGNTVFYIPPEYVHAIIASGGHGETRCLKFYPDVMKNELDIEKILKNSGLDLFSFSVNGGDYSVISAACDIIDDVNANDFEKWRAVFDVFGALKPIAERKTSENAQIKKILNWTEEHFSEPITLERVSTIFHYSKSYFCNMFKSYTGTTYINYLRQVRLSKACSALQSGISVGETAKNCGYETVPYFIKEFKSIFHTTPGKYKVKK